MVTNHPRVEKRNQETVALLTVVLPEYHCMMLVSTPVDKQASLRLLAVLCLDESSSSIAPHVLSWDSESDYEDEEIDDFEDEDLIDDDDLFDDDDDYDDDYDDLEEEDDDYDDDFEDLDVDQDEDDF